MCFSIFLGSHLNFAQMAAGSILIFIVQLCCFSSFVCISISVLCYFWLPKAMKKKLCVRYLMPLFTAKPPTPTNYDSNILPHSPLLVISSNCWLIKGTFPQPGPSFTRNMLIFRTADNCLILHSPVCVSSAMLQELMTLGDRVKYVIIPNSMHRMDALAYQMQFPDAEFICPRKALSKVEECVRIDQVCEEIFPEFLQDNGPQLQEEISFLIPEGLDPAVDELVYLLKLESKRNEFVLVCSDLFFNINPDTADFFTRFIGTARPFGVTSIGKFLMMTDANRFKKWIQNVLLNESKGWSITAIVVGHGDEVIGEESAVKSLLHAVSSVCDK